MATRNQSLIYIVLAVALLGGGIGALLWRARETNQPDLPASFAGRKFCGPDGQLVATQSTQSHRTYCVLVRSDLDGLRPGTPTRFVYTIVDDRGESLRRFATVHEKLMHFILVRRDLQGFQHLHPTFNEDTGEFTLDALSFPSAGPYRLFADFTPAEAQLGPDGEPLGVTTFMDVAVGDTAGFSGQALGAPTLQQNVDGYSIDLTGVERLSAGEEASLRFRIQQGGTPVTDLEPYLGALGHAVVLREGDLQFLHAHAVGQSASTQSGEIAFAVHFPIAGRYKAFIQFQHRGRVVTGAFALPSVQSGDGAVQQPHGGAH